MIGLKMEMDASNVRSPECGATIRTTDASPNCLHIQQQIEEKYNIQNLTKILLLSFICCYLLFSLLSFLDAYLLTPKPSFYIRIYILLTELSLKMFINYENSILFYNLVILKLIKKITCQLYLHNYITLYSKFSNFSKTPPNSIFVEGFAKTYGTPNNNINPFTPVLNF